MAFFTTAVTILGTLVTALGASLSAWGVINLLEGYDNETEPPRLDEREASKTKVIDLTSNSVNE